MQAFITRIFDTSRYTDPIERNHALLVYRTTAIITVCYFLYLTILTLLNTTGVLDEGADIAHPLAVVAFFLLAPFTFWLTRTGRNQLAAWGPVIMYYLATLLVSVKSNFSAVEDGGLLIVLILLAGLLNHGTGLKISIPLSILTLLLGLLPRETIGTDKSINTMIILSLVVIGSAAVIGAFLNYALISRRAGFAAAAEERIKLADITTQVARSISGRSAVQEVLNNTVEQIRQNFQDIYHAQIFLIEENKEGVKVARLAASTGEVGKLLIARQHSLPVGSMSVIGGVTLTGKYVFAHADDEAAVHRKNEFLPETKSEAAFPLRIGDEVIGALDLQSKLVDALPERDAPIYQSLADSVALAIENARLFEEREQRARENQRLVEQTRAALREVEQLNERLTGRAWAEYLRERRETYGLNIDFEANNIDVQAQMTPALRDAMVHRNLVQQQSEDGQVIAVPLLVRGQVIGAVEFELDSRAKFTPQDMDLLQEVSERFGLAAENNRLLEESQRIAQREALVNEIGRRLQGTNNVEATLAEAVRSLQEVLKTQRVAIRLGEPPTSDPTAGKPSADKQTVSSGA